jgi:predicted amidohydrolase YtcJ
MNELTLESLAKRVEALESAFRAKPKKDWRKVVGMFKDSEFMRQVDDECHRSRQAEREAARDEDAAE